MNWMIKLRLINNEIVVCDCFGMDFNWKSGIMHIEHAMKPKFNLDAQQLVTYMPKSMSKSLESNECKEDNQVTKSRFKVTFICLL